MDDHEEKPIRNGVIDELRNVISNLSQSPVPEEVPQEPAPPPAPPPPLENQPSSDVASDTDFWKGNVLGWPSDTSSDSASQSRENTPTKPEFQELPPSLRDRAFLADDIAEPIAKPPPVFEKLPEEKPISQTVSSQGPSPWPIENLLPEQPKTLPPVAAPPLAAPSAALPEVPEPPAPPVPVPGTLSSEEERLSQEQAQEQASLDLEGDKIKPSDLVQIACFYPEGEEKQGQQFVNKLKEVGDKSKPPLALKPVFVNTWSAEKVDVSAWTKSASLSGADVMFVLGFKKDLEQFKSRSSDSLKEGVKIRLIALEHAGLRTLYADIVIELQRGR